MSEIILIILQERENMNPGRKDIWFIGDSRIRHLYFYFVERLLNTTFKNKGGHKDFTYIHNSTKMKITFFWDPFLKRTPELIQKLHIGIDGKNGQKSYIFLSACLHFLQTYKDVKATKMKKWIHKHKSSLEALNNNASTKVVWLMQDHMKTSSGAMSTRVIKYYNQVFRDNLNSTKIILMESVSEVSSIFNDFFPNDITHVGPKSLFHQANLLVNVVCRDHRHYDQGWERKMMNSEEFLHF